MAQSQRILLMKIKYRKLNLISVVQYRYDYINSYSLPTGRVGGVFEGDVA